MPGLTPGGEAQPGGWADWVTGPSRDRIAAALSNQFANGFFKYFVFEDPAYDILRLDLGADLERVRDKLSKDLDAIDPDLGRFKAHGGKLIQYHGWNDPAIPAHSSIVYYEDVARSLGSTDAFYRLYMVPGMLHCGDGPGPGSVDWLGLLDRWVTTGEAPGGVVAASGYPPAPPPAESSTQLLCPYPQVAVRDAPAGFRCALAAGPPTPKPKPKPKLRPHA